jgi:hypothetical protein
MEDPIYHPAKALHINKEKQKQACHDLKKKLNYLITSRNGNGHRGQKSIESVR